MDTFYASLDLCAGNSPVPGKFPAQRPVTRSFDGFFDLRLNKRLRKQSWGWWFEKPSRSLWRHHNENLFWWTRHRIHYLMIAVDRHLWHEDDKGIWDSIAQYGDSTAIMVLISICHCLVRVCAPACVWGWACVSVFCMPVLYAMCWMGVDVSCFIILCYL